MGTVKEVDEADIERYVAQFKSDDDTQKYFTYLGVKLANIICKFPKSDAGKIVLVDTIGIGTTSLGTEEQMLDTVENDSDAIVFMFRPDPNRPRISNNEIDIINEVSSILDVDCKSPDAVEEELLTPILNQLAERISSVDELLMQRLNAVGEIIPPATRRARNLSRRPKSS